MIKKSKILTSNYITSRLQGRTGNMMFQIAHGYAKSLEYNRQYVAPFAESSSKHLEKTLFRKIDFNIPNTSDIDISKYVWSKFEYEELIPDNEIPTVFCGWYQSEKYFEKYKQVIKDMYSPTLDFVDRALKDFPFFIDSTVAAINVRRGDYLHFPTRHPVISVEYIEYAYTKLPKHDILIVVSDDIEWCRQNIKLPNVVYIDNYIDCDGLWLLSLCDYFIISNSTFSWWGAYLSRNPNKVVIAPDTWFGPDILEKTDDIYCQDWIKIPTRWENGYIKLK